MRDVWGCCLVQTLCMVAGSCSSLGTYSNSFRRQWLRLSAPIPPAGAPGCQIIPPCLPLLDTDNLARKCKRSTLSPPTKTLPLAQPSRAPGHVPHCRAVSDLCFALLCHTAPSRPSVICAFAHIVPQNAVVARYTRVGVETRVASTTALSPSLSASVQLDIWTHDVQRIPLTSCLVLPGTSNYCQLPVQPSGLSSHSNSTRAMIAHTTTSTGFRFQIR
jgi:hypothetical protein